MNKGDFPRIAGGTVRVDEILHYLSGDCYFSKKSAAMYTGLSSRFLEKHPEIPRYRLSGRTMFKRSELDAWYRHFRERGTCEEVDIDAIVDELKLGRKR